jgi:transposase
MNRIQKVLEGANIKLASVATNILGVSSRAMIEALIQGEEDPEQLASLARGSLKRKNEQLKQALHGLIGKHQKMILASQLRHIDFLDEQIEQLSQEIQERMRPFEEDLELLDTIPGVGRRIAEQLLAEIGTDMNRYPSAAHLCSWAGMAPGNHESAGKKKPTRTRRGNPSLRTTLVEAARAAARTKNSYLSSRYRRIAARKGANRACIAIGRTILSIAYYMLKRRQAYIELGADYFEQRKRNYVMRQSIRKLETLGFLVTLEAVGEPVS